MLSFQLSAMVVRFITRRFIEDYESIERVYPFSTTIDNEVVNFEILDAAGQLVNADTKSITIIIIMQSFSFLQENECLTATLESNIRWAEVFILVYSVSDKCSFEEVNRLKFLINYNKRRRKIYKVRPRLSYYAATSLILTIIYVDRTKTNCTFPLF